MTHRLALGLSLLATVACSHDRDRTCVEDDGYCDGNVAHTCKVGADHVSLGEWEVRACEAGQTCLKGTCLSEPLVACSTPYESACSDDKTRLGFCGRLGYMNWISTCETAVGEGCYSTGLAREPSCIFPSLGGCSPEGTEMCYQDLVLICTRGAWGRAWYTCDASQGEVCAVGRTGEYGDFVTCILPDMGVCSASDPPTCLGSHILECEPIGRWHRGEDCARYGRICLNGQCMDSTVLPGR